MALVEQKDWMVLNVEVRERKGEYKFRIAVGDGSQHFQWLGNVAAQRYAKCHPQFHKYQFTCVNILQDDGTVFFPFERINECLQDNATVSIELLGKP